MTLLSSGKRIIHFLINHTEEAGRQVGYEYVIKPAITHKETGTIASTSRQTATTVLNELRTKGLIHFNRSYLIIRDLDALKKLANEELPED
ncbi:MAG TPA: helix-turn-helix domain-containing protein [Bacteroidetes bacterium]|nr:helix-turn-helix domain-containing protein [Bacteroidota bacterium]